ncbi:MAG: S1C family serine protease [Bacteroidales bacterium]|nr:S1C family serine protease [Bacteroidales bacterium]MCF8344194.1 S1C family serine protease [Bacteroidales bacterium]MCF8352269.1 S1C family serine protease [Bacteroidales bacterium]MCF8375489.1 S1C family serine protease [Bacteroidales bacterium]MCF8399888.1 S1C family serine protease [Bacteroidales bacterium]
MKRIILIFLTVATFSGLSFGQDASEMLEEKIGAVVTVAVYKNQLAKNALGFRGESATETAYEEALDLAGAQSTGSGFIIKKNGKYYVVTNAHVVETASDEAGSIYVFTINRNKYEVSVLGGDSFYDIALLEFVNNPGAEIATMDFTDSEPRIGQKVYAIGNPLGEYPYSVSDGIISAKNRVRGGQTGKFGFLQTTATLIWGNSGGPLVNEEGEVVGVNSQIAFANLPDGSQILQSQINFALEADISEKLVDDIIKNAGRVERAYLGIELSQSYSYQQAGYDNYYYTEIDELPKLSAVIPGSPAYARLSDKTGAFVTAVDGNEVNNLEEALGELEKVKPGRDVSLTLKEGYSTSTLTIPSRELTNDELMSLARYVLDKNPDINVDYNHPQVSFTMGNSDMYYYENEKKQYRQNKRSGNATQQYFILAAGLHVEGDPNMWIVEDFTNLGAALRLSGMTGAIDYYVFPAGGTEDDLQVARQYLSGREDILQSTLWY